MCKSHRGTSVGFGSPIFILMVIYKSNPHVHTLRGVDKASMCVCTQTLPRAHIQFHHSSNQSPHRPDWIINYPINASLHSVRLSASKYLLIQNNPRRLDYHLKLLLCVAHNQDGRNGMRRAGGWGESSVPSSSFHAGSQISYASRCWWGGR